MTAVKWTKPDGGSMSDRKGCGVECANSTLNTTNFLMKLRHMHTEKFFGILLIQTKFGV